MCNARSSKPYTVIPLQTDDFLDFKSAAILNNTSRDEFGLNVTWMQIKALCVRKDQGMLYIKYNHCDDYRAIPQKSNRAATKGNVTLKQLYESQLSVSTEKTIFSKCARSL